MKVRIYVEGGGDHRDSLTECRKAFHLLFDRCCSEKLRPRFIACGSRSSAYKDFCTSLKSNADEYSILLVESEEPIHPNADAWAHLKKRKDDNWDKPDRAAADQAHLMVQCMESWFLTDGKSLAKFYGQGFSAGILPRNPNVEEVSKKDVCSALVRATQNTDKGRYHKVRHGFPILGKLDFAKVCENPLRARAFRDQTLRKLSE